MRRITAKTLDRAALASAALILAFNLLFVLSVLAALLIHAPKARAEAPACNGKDLIAALQASDPASVSRMRSEAAKTANGVGLLWRIEKPGVAASYLFGTMHMTDPRVVALPAEAKAAFDASATVVIETTDVLDPSKMVAAMAARPELTMFTGSESLPSLLSPEQVEAVRSGLAERGIPFASVARMKPWMLSAMVAVPACELARKSSGAPVLDIKLAEDARRAGKAVEGLETLVDQLQAMASLPMDFHLKGLVDTLKLGSGIDDAIETMIVLYTKGETGMFWPMFRAVLPSEADSDGGYAAFEETMVTARNRTMAERAAPIIDRGAAFIAVGALHLPGDKGVVGLLRQAGYSVERAD